MKYSARYLIGRSVLIGLFMIPALVFAQSFRGSIRGKVVDPNGGLVAGAKVSTRSVETGLTREAATNDEGTYVLAELPAGRYTVTGTASGVCPGAHKGVGHNWVGNNTGFHMREHARQHEVSILFAG